MGTGRRTGQISKPNFIIVFTDDQGYNDLGCFNSKLIKTPCIDKMASEGLKLTSFYDGAPLCAPSRASLLTGCYSQRVAERDNRKMFHTILDSSEILLSEVLKATGYATCAIGKWHLAGCCNQAIATDANKDELEQYSAVDPTMMPLQKGFDRYFGIPYSNDMDPVVLMRDNDFVEFMGQTEKQAGLTTRYGDEALEFIEEKKDGPFFLYLAHNMPHTPLYPGEKFAGTSDYGIYGDCVEEIDWNTGRILDKLDELGIADNTFVIFTSDNGPWIEASNPGRTSEANTSRYQGGTAAPLRGYKMTTWDGGPRVPCVMRYPHVIPAGSESDELITSMDISATLTKLADTHMPTDRITDGMDMMPLLTGAVRESPRECYYFYKFTYLHAVRSGKWKLVLPREARVEALNWYSRLQEEVKEVTLFDLENDIGETTNIAADNPDIVARLMVLIERARADLGDATLGIEGPGWRKVPT